jgi:hypothetical protein
MKKLNLNLQLTENVELLTRGQLKTIMGGVAQPPSTSPNCISRGGLCSPTTEETDCCGSGQCLSDGNPHTGYVCK